MFDCLLLIGVFILKLFDENILLFVGGSGIIFVLLIFKFVLVVGGKYVVLVYVN